MSEKPYYVYVLRCSDNSLYTGLTTDVVRRLSEHCGTDKGGAKYTRTRKPLYIESVWMCASRQDASKLEYAFKKLLKAKKEQLVSNPALFEAFFSESLCTQNYNYLKEYKKQKNTAE